MVLGNFGDPRNTGKQWSLGNTFGNILFFGALLKMLHLNGISQNHMTAQSQACEIPIPETVLLVMLNLEPN